MESNTNEESIENFPKLTYRQRFAITEYGYLLSPEDAEVVGKMLGNFQEKDVLPFCQAYGKKVSGSEETPIFDSQRPSNLHLDWGQKVLVFVLSILIVPFLTFHLVAEVFSLTSFGGDGAAIIAWVFGLPIGIILGIILPFILFAFLEKNRQPDKETI